MENQGQIQSVVCPNCGANATNFRNCEYCGSALVQCSVANTKGAGVDIDYIKETLCKCNSQGIENVFKRLQRLNEYYVNAGVHDSQLMVWLKIGHIDTCITFEVSANEIDMSVDPLSGNMTKAEYEKLKDFVKKLFPIEEGWIVGHDMSFGASLGSDAKVASQLCCNILGCIYEGVEIESRHIEFMVEDNMYSIVDMTLDAEGNYIDRELSDLYFRSEILKAAEEGQFNTTQGSSQTQSGDDDSDSYDVIWKILGVIGIAIFVLLFLIFTC